MRCCLPCRINSRIRNNKDPWGNSLVVQGLGLHALTVKGVGWPPRWGTKIPQAAQWSKSKKNKRKEIKILAHCLTQRKHSLKFPFLPTFSPSSPSLLPSFLSPFLSQIYTGTRKAFTLYLRTPRTCPEVTPWKRSVLPARPAVSVS